MSIIRPEAPQNLWHVQSEAALESLASDLYARWQGYACFALHGPLGAGKSVFARALIRHLRADPALEVPSPTFTLVQTYDTARGPVWHFDLYRLGMAEELRELGWEEALQAPLMLIEWPERAGPWLPQRRVDITITPDPCNTEARHVEGRVLG